jgi:hypothetical protein
VAEALEEFRVCQHVGDLAGLAACDLVLIPNSACPIPAFLAERLLPAAPVPSPPAVTAVGRGRRGGAAA